MMNAPLRPGTRPVGAAQLAVKDTSTNGPVVAATPRGDDPRPHTYLLFTYFTYFPIIMRNVQHLLPSASSCAIAMRASDSSRSR